MGLRTELKAELQRKNERLRNLYTAAEHLTVALVEEKRLKGLILKACVAARNSTSALRAQHTTDQSTITEMAEEVGRLRLEIDKACKLIISITEASVRQDKLGLDLIQENAQLRHDLAAAHQRGREEGIEEAVRALTHCAECVYVDGELVSHNPIDIEEASKVLRTLSTTSQQGEDEDRFCGICGDRGKHNCPGGV